MAEASGSIPKQSCAGIRRDGQRCSAPVLGSAAHCYAHDPACAADRDAAGRRGGRNRSSVARAKALMPARLAPIFATLETALDDVLAGRLDPRQASAAAAISRALVALVVSGELEERLRRIEQERAHA